MNTFDFSPLIVPIGIVITALATVMATVVTTLGIGWNARAKAKAVHDKALQDIKTIQENARLAAIAAEQLGGTNEEKALHAIQFSNMWNTAAGVMASIEIQKPAFAAAVFTETEHKGCDQTADTTLPPDPLLPALG